MSVIFRELEPPTGQYYPRHQDGKALSSKKNWEGPGRVRAPENVGARRDLRDN